MYWQKNKSKGFTLIELLVVISIISILASIVTISAGSFRANARDVKRVTDLNQIQSALELYFDFNGEYPQTPGGGWVHNCDLVSTWSPFMQTNIGSYLSHIPDDPSASNPWPLCYFYKPGAYFACSPGTLYTLVFATEVRDDFDKILYSIQGEAGTAARYCLHP